MNWLPNAARSLDVSECGRYEVRRSVDPTRGEFFNGWFMPTGKHVDADRQREVVRKSCERHAAKELA